MRMSQYRLSATLDDIREGIRSRPGRNLLAVLAIAIGAGSLAVLVAILGGLSERAQQLVDELGGNVAVVLAPGETTQGNTPRLTKGHIDLLAENLGGSRLAGMRVHRILLPGDKQPLTLVATSEQLADIRRWRTTAGRGLDYQDVTHHQRNLVISEALARHAHWRPGDVVLLESTPFNVVGIVATGGSAAEAGLGQPGMILGEKVAIMPHTADRYWSSDPDSARPGFDALFIGAPAGTEIADVVGRAQRLLAQPDQSISGLSWITPETLIAGIRELQDVIGITVGSIAGLCLILGGATLASLMIANVRERVTEIGLRRALGATRRDIVVLFACEALAVTLIAGIAGTLLTHLLLLLARQDFPVPLAMGWASALTPVLVSTIVGAVFAGWPARNASRIMPAEALRND